MSFHASWLALWTFVCNHSSRAEPAFWLFVPRSTPVLCPLFWHGERPLGLRVDHGTAGLCAEPCSRSQASPFGSGSRSPERRWYLSQPWVWCQYAGPAEVSARSSKHAESLVAAPDVIVRAFRYLHHRSCACSWYPHCSSSENR